MRNIINSFERVHGVPFVYICLKCISIFTCSLSPSLGFCLFLFWHQCLEPSLEVVNDSNLGSFFYETVYDAVSAIDYSKEPLDVGVINSPPSKQIFQQSPSVSPLKSIECNCVQASPSWPSGNITPQRRLRMDVRPANSGSLHGPLRDALPLQANSNMSTPHAKVTSRPWLNHTLQVFLS